MYQYGSQMSILGVQPKPGITRARNKCNLGRPGNEPYITTRTRTMGANGPGVPLLRSGPGLAQPPPLVPCSGRQLWHSPTPSPQAYSFFQFLIQFLFLFFWNKYFISLFLMKETEREWYTQKATAQLGFMVGLGTEPGILESQAWNSFA